MNAADFDDLDDPGPVRPANVPEVADYRDPPSTRRPGFGFWLAVAWCLLYVLVSQIIGAIICFGIALALAVSRHGMELLTDASKLNAWLAGPEGRIAILWTAAGTQFLGLALSWLLLRLWCGRTWKRKIALTRGPTATHAALILVGLPALIALSAASDLLIKHVPSMQRILEEIGIHVDMQGTNEAVAELVKKAPWGLAIFAVAVSPGICEEMFCRGFLAQGLAGRYRTWAVVAIVSFLFGCIHMDPQQGVGAMLLALAIHAAYVATRSLPVAMFIHFANNGLAVVHYNESLFPVLSVLEGPLERNPALYLLGSLCLFAATAFALYQTLSCRLAPTVDGLEGWQSKDVSGVELPPPNSGTVMAHEPLSPVSAALVVAGAVAFGVMLVLL